MKKEDKYTFLINLTCEEKKKIKELKDNGYNISQLIRKFINDYHKITILKDDNIKQNRI